MLTILVQDACTLRRAGLRVLLNELSEVHAEKLHILEFESPEAVQYKGLKSDLIVLSVQRWIFEVLTLLEKIHSHWPEAGIVLHDSDMLSDWQTREQVINRGFSLGLRGYFAPQTPPDKIKAVIQAALQGNVLLQDFRFNQTPPKHGQRWVKAYLSLSAREKEVLQLLTQNLSNPEIAEKLCISLRTVESHKNSIRQKFGVKTAFPLIQPELAYLLYKSNNKHCNEKP